MLPDTAETLSARGTEVAPGEVESLNPQLDSVQVGDRLRLVLSLGSFDYAREFLCTSFPILCTPGSHLDLGEYLQPDTSTAAFDFATGYMTIEADVIREASPGVLLAVVLVAAVIALAAIFPNATVVAVDRLKRAFQTVAGGVGQVVGGTVSSATSGVVQGLGFSGTALLVLAALAFVALSPQGRMAYEAVRARR